MSDVLRRPIRPLPTLDLHAALPSSAQRAAAAAGGSGLAQRTVAVGRVAAGAGAAAGPRAAPKNTTAPRMDGSADERGSVTPGGGQRNPVTTSKISRGDGGQFGSSKAAIDLDMPDRPPTKAAASYTRMRTVDANAKRSAFKFSPPMSVDLPPKGFPSPMMKYRLDADPETRTQHTTHSRLDRSTQAETLSRKLDTRSQLNSHILSPGKSRTSHPTGVSDARGLMMTPQRLNR